MPKGNRSLISLECTVCKERNYTTTKNRRKQQDKLELSEVLLASCRKHTAITKKARSAEPPFFVGE